MEQKEKDSKSWTVLKGIKFWQAPWFLDGYDAPTDYYHEDVHEVNEFKFVTRPRINHSC